MSTPLQADPLLQPTPSNSLIPAQGYKSSTQVIMTAYKAYSFSLLQGPQQPNNNTSSEIFSHSAQAHSDDFHPSVNSTDPPSPLHILYKNPHNTSPLCPANSLMGPHPSYLRKSNQLVSHPKGTLPQQASPIRLPTSGMSPPGSDREIPSDPSGNRISPQKSKKRKGKQLPTRHSQRLQAKQPAFATLPKRSIRTMTVQREYIFFLTLKTPIDITKTLQILQATGLEINKQVQDLIEEAIRKDLEEGRITQTAEQIMPTTPLHDPSHP